MAKISTLIHTSLNELNEALKSITKASFLLDFLYIMFGEKTARFETQHQDYDPERHY